MLPKIDTFKNWGLKAIAPKKIILILILRTSLNQTQSHFHHIFNS
jgi:hypothetical protein